MTRNRLILAVAGVVLVALAAGVWTFRPSSSPASFFAGQAPSSSAPAPAAGPSSERVARASTPPAARAAAPEPFVQGFAQQPGVRPQPRLPSPTAKLTQPVNIDGCDHGYGARTQCVPWTFPPGTTDKCAWLAAHGFKQLKVLGADRHHLDPDHNGVACD